MKFCHPLGIAEYITRCSQALSKFESLVHKIQKNANDIEGKLLAIESANLFKCLTKKSTDLPGNTFSMPRIKILTIDF